MTIQELMNLPAPSKLTDEQVSQILGSAENLLSSSSSQLEKDMFVCGWVSIDGGRPRRPVEVMGELLQKAYAIGQKSIRDAAVDAHLDQAEEQELFQGFLRHWMNTGGLVRPTYDQVDGWAPNTDATTIVWSYLCKLGIAFDSNQEAPDFVEVNLPSGAILNLSRDDAETLL